MLIDLTDLAWFDYVWLCLTYFLDSEKRTVAALDSVHVSSPAATKETGTPWASERIACVAPVEEESQGCLKMIEMHHGHIHGPKNEWLIRGIIMIYPWHTWLLQDHVSSIYFFGSFWSTIDFLYPIRRARKLSEEDWWRKLETI